MISKRYIGKGYSYYCNEDSGSLSKFSGPYMDVGGLYRVFGKLHRLYGIAFIDSSWDPWYINDKSLVGFKKRLNND